MDSKVLQVFYDNQCYPFKDSARSVRYPIVGSTFTGANNTTAIKFYVDRIGGVQNVTWIAITKLPNGQIGNEIVSDVGYDDELGEYYLTLNLSSFYTSIKGDIHISLNGYQGGVNVSLVNGVYEVSGTPTIMATGTIKLSINYAPQTMPGSHFQVSDLQQVLGALSDYLKINDGIVVVNNDPVDLTGYDDGQLFYVISDQVFKQLVSGSLVTFDTGYVPYSGAAHDVNLGNHKLTAQDIEILSNVHHLNVFNGDLYIETGSGNIVLNPDGIVSYKGSEIANKDYALGKNEILELSSLGVLSDNDFALAQKENIIIKYGLYYYRRVFENLLADTITFEKLIEYSNGIARDLLTKNILTLNLTTKNITNSIVNVQFYNKLQADSLLNDKANVSDVANDLNGKVDKTSGQNKVYATDNSGNQTTLPYDTFVTGQVVRRVDENSGNIYVGNASAPNHATPKSYVDNKVAALGTVLNYKGSKTVAQLNALTGQVAGDVYNVTDAGTLSAGSVEVLAGDNIVWTSNSVWDKLAGTVDLSGYVLKTQTIAGLALSGNISEKDLFERMNIKGRYATLTALQTASPSHDYCYLVEENNHWYYWNGSAWTDGGVYQATGIGINSIELEQLKKDINDNFESLNLFDKTKVVTGGYFASNGSISTESNSQYSTQYISVKYGTTYKFSHFINQLCIATYDENGNFLGRVNVSSDNTVSFGSSVAYVKLSLYMTSFGSQFMMCDIANFPSSYIDYLLKIKTDTTLKNENLPANSKAVGDMFGNISYKTPNLFDKSTIIDGYHFNSSGVPSPQAGSQYSTQYIPVDPSKTYSFTPNNLSSALFITYDENKQVIARITPNSATNYSFGAGVYYVRLSYYLYSFGDNYMFVEGNTLPSDYIKHGYLIKNSALPEDIIKSCYLKYVANSSTANPEDLFIYIPSKDGYIRYELKHYNYAPFNCNCWRLGRIFKADSSFVETKILTDNGEIEMAIKIKGRPDYIGGYSHGDEIDNDITFIVDGKIVDITDFTDFTNFETLRIIENTNMYDPNDNITHVANHGKEYIFSEKGFVLNQSVNWITNQIISEAYLTMLIGPQSYNSSVVTDNYYTDKDFVIREIPSETSRTFYPKAKEATLIGETYGILDNFELLEYPTGLSGGDQIELRVTSGSNNKLYAIVVYDIGDGQSVSSGDIWKSKTKFNFE